MSDFDQQAEARRIGALGPERWEAEGVDEKREALRTKARAFLDAIEARDAAWFVGPERVYREHQRAARVAFADLVIEALPAGPDRDALVASVRSVVAERRVVALARELLAGNG